MPDLALDFLLRRQNQSRNDVSRYMIAQAGESDEDAGLERIESALRSCLHGVSDLTVLIGGHCRVR